MPVEPLNPSGIAKPLGHLSNAALSGSRLYLAGLVGLDADGKLVGEGSMREQTLHICRSIEQICLQHGASLAQSRGASSSSPIVTYTPNTTPPSQRSLASTGLRARP